jgi:hypothetical protein
MMDTWLMWWLGEDLTLNQGGSLELPGHACNETAEKPTSQRLMENVHMEGFRNGGPARRAGDEGNAALRLYSGP